MSRPKNSPFEPQKLKAWKVLVQIWRQNWRNFEDKNSSAIWVDSEIMFFVILPQSQFSPLGKKGMNNPNSMWVLRVRFEGDIENKICSALWVKRLD